MSKLAEVRLTSIDALRGIAALSVLALHAFEMVWIGPREYSQLHPLLSFDPIGWLGWLLMPLRYGGWGVQLFFVLSGYCIHRSQARSIAAGDTTRPLQVGRFYLRRLFRIYPTYVAAIAFAGVLRYVLLPYLGSHGYVLVDEDANAQHSWQVLGINLIAMQNVLPLPGAVFAPARPYELTFWTLSLEIHFYLLYPLVLMMIRKMGAINMLVLAFFVGILWTVAAYLFWNDPLGNFFLYLTLFAPFWFTWCMGAYVAELEAEGELNIRFLPLISASGIALGVVATLATKYIPHPPSISLAWEEFPLAIGIGAGMLWLLNSKRLPWWGTWPARLLAFVGLFSYSLYAIHFSCLRVYRTLVGTHHTSPVAGIVGCLIILPVAYLFFLLFERWSLRAPAWLKGKQRAPSGEAVVSGGAAN